jgi:hypothetical protein
MEENLFPEQFKHNTPIEFQATENDYKRFIRSYFFKRNLVRRLTLLIILSLLIGNFNQSNQHFILTTFIFRTFVSTILIFLFFGVTPYVIAKMKLAKNFKTDFLTRPKTIVTSEDGIIITAENENAFWKWESLKNAELIDGCLFISLFTNKFYYLIPISAFKSDNEMINFFGVLKSNIQKVRGGNQLRKIRNLYYCGLVGFIPNFGVIAGIILLIKGIQYNKLTLIAIGVGDIVFTVFFWMVVFPLLNPNGFKDVSQMELNNLVQNVEFYKLQFGHYPDSLQQLPKSDNRMPPIYDAIQMDKHRQNIYYNYRRVGDNYILFSSGQDGIPGTMDDLFPQIQITDSSKIGLIKRDH